MRGWRLYAWAFNSQNHPERSTFYVDRFMYKIRGNHLVSCQPTQFQPPQNPFFGPFLLHNVFPRLFAPNRLVSKDIKFSCASFGLCLKFVARCPPSQTPTQKFEIEFSIFTSQEIGSSLVSF